jgi:hypothetical protein
MATGDGPEVSYWPQYNDSSAFTEVLHEYEGNVAADVLNEFNIPCVSVSEGGPLKNLDIKLMDPMTVINLSLIEHAANGGSTLYEPVVNEDGEVEFVGIGDGSSTLDIYRTIHSRTYTEEIVGVLVQGGKPLPIRHALNWKPIWVDEANKEIIQNSQIVTGCISKKNQRFALVLFDDPHFKSEYEDGLENWYEINKTNPYDTIIGWAFWINPGDKEALDTKIGYQETCDLPMNVSYSSERRCLGDLFSPPRDPNNVDAECLEGLGEYASPEDGLKIDIPASRRFETVRNTVVDKFIKVSGVYAVGYRLKKCYGRPKIPKSGLSESDGNNTIVNVSFESNMLRVFKLSEGTHYVISFEEYSEEDTVPKIPHIVFAKQTRKGDNGNYGDHVEVCVLQDSAKVPSASEGGYDIVVKNKKNYINDMVVLPTGGVEGIAVKEILATVAFESPCIVIEDPNGRAKEIAEDLVFNISPLVVTNEAAPYAYNGAEVDLIPGIADHDPTTKQDFDDTPLELIKIEMANGNGVALSYSFMDKDQIETLSGLLKNLLNKGAGVETVHVCGPDSEPKLGMTGPSGGIINSINYSYNDSGSYTISVTEGPWAVGSLANISSGYYVKQTEEESGMGGTIIQDLGNNIHYKVNIAGVGDVTALNCCKDFLRVGDRVQCTVHNLPMEA